MWNALSCQQTQLALIDQIQGKQSDPYPQKEGGHCYSDQHDVTARSKVTRLVQTTC